MTANFNYPAYKQPYKPPSYNPCFTTAVVVQIRETRINNVMCTMNRVARIINKLRVVWFVFVTQQCGYVVYCITKTQSRVPITLRIKYFTY